jgi:acyl dehydratase
MNVSHVSSRHVLQQGPMLRTLGKTAARAFAQRVLPQKRGALITITPGPERKRSFAPLSSALLDAYVKHVGGDVRAYRELVPPHFFPHWAMPVAAETFKSLPYPILRVVNAGCRMQVNAMLPRGEALHVRAHLAEVDDDGKRAILTARVITETESAPNALVVDIHAFVPLRAKRDGNGAARKSNGNGAPKASRADADKPRVPRGVHEIDFIKLSADAGLSFAKLTGDFNPIHWLPAYAKTAGFRNVILHGFGTFARACESLNRGLLGGDVRKLRLLEAKFTRPLVLPHAVGVYVHERDVFVGDGIEGPAYMSGHFATGDDR